MKFSKKTKRFYSLVQVAVSVFSAVALAESPKPEVFDEQMDTSIPFVCGMIGAPLPGGFSSSEIQSYQSKLIRECEIAEEFRKQSQLARKKFDIGLTDISVYQAIRYLERSRYDQGRASGQALELTYQICYADYDRPIAERSSIIWRNWIAGATQVEPASQKLRRASRFQLDDLLRAHAGFYRLSDEFCPRTEGEKRTGHNNLPYPGKLKPSNSLEKDRHWWKFSNDDEAIKAKLSTEKINSYYRELGILGHVYAEDGIGYSDVLSVRRLQERSDNQVGQNFAIWSGESSVNEHHLAGLLRLLNTLNAQARSGGHMIWETASGRKILKTPGELAYLVQQYMVQIHPFSEGNGRLSRFIQEIVLRSFDLPHGPSGDLMDDDVLSTHEDYYKIAIQKMEESLADTDRCLLDVYPAVLGNGPGVQLRHMDQSKIPYECRILR